MSKAVKSVGKAFKKIGKAVKKIIKPIAVAAAVYFTAGVALSFIPATSAFAASLPGFAGGGVLGTGVGAGATAGTGIFSKIAKTVGLGGGATKVAAAGPPAAGKMALSDKLLMAKIGTDVAGALFGPTEEDLIEAKSKYRGSFYGMDSDGNMAPPEIGAQQPQAQPQAQQPQTPAMSPMGDSMVPEQLFSTQQSPDENVEGMRGDAQRIVAGRERAKTLFEPAGMQRKERGMQQSQPGLFGEGQMKQQIPYADDVFSPAAGVRYV